MKDVPNKLFKKNPNMPGAYDDHDEYDGDEYDWFEQDYDFNKEWKWNPNGLSYSEELAVRVGWRGKRKSRWP